MAKLKYTKVVIRIRKSKKDRKYNGHKTTNKRINNDLLNITHKAKHRVTRTLLKTGGKEIFNKNVDIEFHYNIFSDVIK